MNQWTHIAVKPLGSKRATIEWAPVIDRLLLDHILALQIRIEEYFGPSLLAQVKTYHTVTLLFGADIEDFNLVCNAIQTLNEEIDVKSNVPKNHLIPTLYHRNLEEIKSLSTQLERSPQEIIQLHQQQKYDVHFFGFIPGFMYLGGLDPQLHIARKDRINPQIKKGSIAIAGRQTGIYPSDSPGGWWVIGEIVGQISFDKIQPGDTITFKETAL